MTQRGLDPDTRELAEAKLASSGLSWDDAEELGIVALTPAQTKAFAAWAKALPALRFDYFGPDGEPLSAWPNHPPFYRLRYLRQPIDDDQTGFAKSADKSKMKQLRYVQPPGTSVAAYLPRNGTDWPAILSDVDEPLIITEGELKAACACHHGFPTVGLGGVDAWRALAKGVELVPELAAAEWVGRNVYVCFDSDYRFNPSVLRALEALGEELVRRGAYVHVVSLPQVSDDKVGLDDFIVNEGEAAFAEALAVAEPLGLTQPLFDLNSRYVYVRSPGLLVRKSDHERLAPGSFTEHIEATKLYQERALRPDGTLSRRAISAASAWLHWPLRHEVSAVTYRPGVTGATVDDEGRSVWSIWPGWGADPAPAASDADVAPFLKLVHHVFTGATRAAIEWFLDWCAYPLQNPGTKLYSSVLVHGIAHGTGKSVIGYTLGRIYGKNFTLVKTKDLHDGFNEWAEAKQFVMGDEITGSDKRAENDILKGLITQETVRINKKFLPTYEVPDCINWYFTSNHPDAFFLEDDDRRNFIHEVTVGPLDEEFYVSYDLWYKTIGPALIHRWLLDRDTSGFNPAGKAFSTAAKDRMIADARSDLGGWVRALKDTPDSMLRMGDLTIDRDLFTSRELLALYDPMQRTGTTANGLGRELKRAGVRQVLEGQPVTLPDGTREPLYAVRNPDRWVKASLHEVQRHLAPAPAAKRARY